MATFSFAFLMGAGASTGIGKGRVKPSLPPVMKELYTKLAEENPGQWGANSPLGVHAERFRENFEKTYADLVLRYPEGGGSGPVTPDTLSLLKGQEPLARYFSRFLLDHTGSDCYSRLLLNLKKSGIIERSIFGSLNYECLFEQAARRLSLRVDYWCDEIDPNVVRLAKIHGSCNFVTQRFDAYQQGILAAQGGHYGVTVDPLPVDDLEQKLSAELAAGRFPVMSQISPEKENLFDSTKFQEARYKWHQGVSNALENVIVIGVSCNPNDTHILEPIKSASVPLLYIGGNGDFEKWRQVNSGFEFLRTTFEEGLQLLLSRLGI